MVEINKRKLSLEEVKAEEEVGVGGGSLSYLREGSEAALCCGAPILVKL